MLQQRELNDTRRDRCRRERDRCAQKKKKRGSLFFFFFLRARPQKSTSSYIIIIKGIEKYHLLFKKRNKGGSAHIQVLFCIEDKLFF